MIAASCALVALSRANFTKTRIENSKILLIILIYLYAGITPPASSPDTCALPVPTLAILLQLRSRLLPKAALPCALPSPQLSVESPEATGVLAS